MLRAERRRLLALLEREREERVKGFRAVAGVDEAGRGPLAGPVVAVACLLPDDLLISGVNDSKKLSAERRQEIDALLRADARVVIGVGEIDNAEIDRINIFQATIQAMLRAVAALSAVPDLLLVDGLQLPHPTIPARKIIGGDGSCYSIAAASILAKVHRDRLMCAFHQQWPAYGFDRHKGYATDDHRRALEEHGPCPIHRLTFEPLKSLVGAPVDG